MKGVNFVGLKDVGDAVELGSRYALEGADELVYLDISATVEGRKTFTTLVERIAQNINIPFTVGGGISTMDDAARLLDAGADKISINRKVWIFYFNWCNIAVTSFWDKYHRLVCRNTLSVIC